MSGASAGGKKHLELEAYQDLEIGGGVMNKISDKIYSFLDPAEIEPGAMRQVENISKLPFIFHHIAVMPDCHLGKGATVGSVMATKGAIVAAAVGVDIGCGMIAVKTRFAAGQLPDGLKQLREGIERRIPTGFSINETADGSALRRVKELNEYAGDQPGRKIHPGTIDPRWLRALGSLGGGNHFIEVCLDELDTVWVVLHSGSRGIGNKMAQIHIEKAKGIMKQYFIALPDPDLAYLIDGTEEFSAYIRDLLWAQKFALLNREEMMDRVMAELSLLFFKEEGHENEIEEERINCHHNFSQKENHMGANVWVTRKGAIQMRQGQMGVIPGSMGTHSYIVSGLENPVAFHSAPHGAGRRFSRTEARRRFNMDDFDAAMMGIEHRRSDKLIDELPGAYKDIDAVMENSKELVKIEHTLKQVLNVKGD